MKSDDKKKVPTIPVLRYTCKHVKSSKVVTRDYIGGGIITSIDLCKECLNDPVFSGTDESYKDTKITKQVKVKPRTSAQLKKTIKNRQKEIKSFEVDIRNIWQEPDKVAVAGKLLEHYASLCKLYENLESLNEQYIRKLEK